MRTFSCRIQRDPSRHFEIRSKLACWFLINISLDNHVNITTDKIHLFPNLTITFKQKNGAITNRLLHWICFWSIGSGFQIRAVHLTRVNDGFNSALSRPLSIYGDSPSLGSWRCVQREAGRMRTHRYNVRQVPRAVVRRGKGRNFPARRGRNKTKTPKKKQVE